MEKLRTVYRKFLYGGDTSDGGSLYKSKPVKNEPKQPQIPSLLQGADWNSPFKVSKPLVTNPEDPYELKVPKADDVPSVPIVKPHVIEPVVPEFNLPTKNPVEFPKKASGFDPIRFREDIKRVESQGNYKALPLRNGKLISSAAGAYQFLWNTWGNDIRKVTGVRDKNSFLNNKEAQDKYMEHYTQKTILPAVGRLRSLGAKMNLGDEDIAKLVHFQGEEGARRQLASGKLSGKTSTNLGVKEYLEKSKGNRNG